MPGHFGARPPPFYRGYSAEDYIYIYIICLYHLCNPRWYRLSTALLKIGNQVTHVPNARGHSNTCIWRLYIERPKIHALKWDLKVAGSHAHCPTRCDAAAPKSKPKSTWQIASVGGCANSSRSTLFNIEHDCKRLPLAIKSFRKAGALVG